MKALRARGAAVPSPSTSSAVTGVVHPPRPTLCAKKQPNSLTIIISNLRARAGWMTPDTADRVDGHETAGSRHV